MMNVFLSALAWSLLSLIPAFAAADTFKKQCFSDTSSTGAHMFHVDLDTASLAGSIRWQWYEMDVVYKAEINSIEDQLLKGRASFERLITGAFYHERYPRRGFYSDVPSPHMREKPFSYNIDLNSFSFMNVDHSACVDIDQSSVTDKTSQEN